MTVNRLSLLALTLCVSISGCSSVLTATRDNPIEDDRGTRTFGSKIDDSLIETKAAVNIANDISAPTVLAACGRTGRGEETLDGFHGDF